MLAAYAIHLLEMCLCSSPPTLNRVRVDSIGVHEIQAVVYGFVFVVLVELPDSFVRAPTVRVDSRIGCHIAIDDVEQRFCVSAVCQEHDELFRGSIEEPKRPDLLSGKIFALVVFHLSKLPALLINSIIIC